jgi:uncharacterized protein (TIGR03083 family)
MSTSRREDRPAGSHAGSLALTVDQFVSVVATEGEKFAAAARRGDLETPVPTCPGWNVRDLVRHLGEIHLWAAARVARRTTKLWLDDLSELTESWPELGVFWPDDDDLIDWYLETNTNLVRALQSAPSDLEAPTFLPAPSPLAMWARRQAHEASVHRFDAENATGEATGFDPTFAADGIGELLYGFSTRDVALPIAGDRTMHVHAEDTGTDWRLTIGPGGISEVPGAPPADLALTGTASDLYLVLWNREADSAVSVTGDSELLGHWHGNSRVRWR